MDSSFNWVPSEQSKIFSVYHFMYVQQLWI